MLATASIIGNNKEDMIYSDIATLANEKLKSNDYSEAIELFKQAIKINPTDEELYIGLADSYNGVNESDMARETLETGYIETKSENIKTELKNLKKVNLIVCHLISLRKIHQKAQQNLSHKTHLQKKANLLHRVVSLLMKPHKVQIQGYSFCKDSQ